MGEEKGPNSWGGPNVTMEKLSLGERPWCPKTKPSEREASVECFYIGKKSMWDLFFFSLGGTKRGRPLREKDSPGRKNFPAIVRAFSGDGVF